MTEGETTRRSPAAGPGSRWNVVLAGVLALCAARAPAARVEATPGLLFAVTYDGQTEKADFAAGRAESRNFARTLQYEQAPGVIGAGFQTAPNERCDYAMAGNFEPRQGAVSLWVRLEDWRPADARAYAFFVAEMPGRYRLLLHKPANAPEIVCEVAVGGITRRVKADASHWRPSEWHALVAAWTPDRLWLYVDGEPAGQTLPDPAAAPPAADASGVLSINPNNWFGQEAVGGTPARVSVDEIRIQDHPSAPEDVRAEFARVKALLIGGVYRAPRVTIPFRARGIVTDGRLSPEEWSESAAIPVPCLRGRPTPATRPATVRLQYDARNLYVGFHAPGATPPPARHTGRDAYVWEDAALEFVWHTGGASNTTFQAVINSLNAIYDTRNNLTAWNGITNTAARVGPDGWSAELALAFADLGVAPPRPGTVWTGNFMHDWDQRAGGYATWAVTERGDGKGGFGNAATLGSLVFGDAGPAVQMEASLGDLALGRVRTALALAGGGDGGEEWPARFRLTSEKAAPVVSEQRVKSGAHARFEAPAPVGGAALLAVEMLDARGESRFVYDQNFQVKPPVVLAYKCWPYRRTLEISLDLSNLDAALLERLGNGSLTGAVSLVTQDAQTSLSERTVTPTNAVSAWMLPFPADLPVGEYAVRARLPRPDGGLFEASKPFRVPGASELDPTLGADGSIPAPWTPVRCANGAVTLLNRVYTLGTSPFPVAMTSLDAAVLDQPWEWRLATAAGEETITWTVPEVVRAADDVVVLSGTGRAAKSGLDAAYECRVEFDGLWMATVTLKPSSAPVEVKFLEVRGAVASGSSEYVLAPLLRPWEEGRVLLDLFEDIQGAPSSRAPIGHFWLTGMKTGLHVFTPTDGNWVYQPGKPNVRLDRGAERTGVRLLLIHKPTVLRGPAAYTLGLTATPARPQPRRTQLSGDHEWIFQPGKWQSWISLVPTDPEGLRRGVQAKRDKGYKFLYQYSCAYVLGPNSPYEDYWGATWALRNQPFASEMFGGCPNSTVRHVVVSHAERLAREFGIGPYFDMFGVDWCNNREHGCGYTDSFGREARTSTIPGLRDEMKRIYRLTHRHGGRVLSHNHSLFVVPVHTFSDEWLPGEQYCSLLPGRYDGFYTRVVPQTDYRIEMNPLIHGVQMVFIPQFARAADLSGDKDFERWFRPDFAWAAEQVLAAILPHDIAACGANIHAAPLDKVSEIYRRHGVALRADDPRPDAVFTGYWDSPAVATDDAKLLLSVYRLPAGGALAVLSNPTAEERQAKLAIDAAALALTPPLAVRDEYRGEDLPAWESRPVSVPGGSFRLLWIRGQTHLNHAKNVQKTAD